MAAERALSINRIANINLGCSLVNENMALDATVSYRLGRLGDFTDQIISRVRKDTIKRQAEHQAKLEKLTEIEKVTANKKFQVDHDALMEADELLRTPKFKYSDFVADSDKKVLTAHGIVEYKSGQTLVPVRFFALLGDLIEDDKGLMKGMLESDEAKDKKKTPVK